MHTHPTTTTPQRTQPSSRRGWALYEAALAIPIVLLLIVGALEYGRAFMVGQLVTTAAREGGRRIIAGSSSNASIAEGVKDWLYEFGRIERDDVNVTVTVTPYPGNPDPPENEVARASRRDLVTIKVEVPFKKVSLIPATCLRSTVLAAQSAAVYE